MHIFNSTICYWKNPRSTRLPKPSVKPSPIQRLQIYNAIATAANNDRGIDAVTPPIPFHPRSDNHHSKSKNM